MTSKTKNQLNPFVLRPIAQIVVFLTRYFIGVLVEHFEAERARLGFYSKSQALVTSTEGAANHVCYALKATKQPAIHERMSLFCHYLDPVHIFISRSLLPSPLFEIAEIFSRAAALATFFPSCQKSRKKPSQLSAIIFYRRTKTDYFFVRLFIISQKLAFFENSLVKQRLPALSQWTNLAPIKGLMDSSGLRQVLQSFYLAKLYPCVEGI